MAKFNRSEVRHALYRIKNGVPTESKQEIYDLVKPMIHTGESWATFASGWDVFVTESDIVVIKPEVDYTFIHDTCLEKALCEKNKIKFDASERQANVIQIVELNMLDKLMSWETYNKAWGVSLDRELKRISTRLFITVVNKVTPEMIEASKKSDGSELTQLPELPVVELKDSRPMTKEEEAMFKNLIKTSPKKKNGKA